MNPRKRTVPCVLWWFSADGMINKYIADNNLLMMIVMSLRIWWNNYDYADDNYFDAGYAFDENYLDHEQDDDDENIEALDQFECFTQNTSSQTVRARSFLSTIFMSWFSRTNWPIILRPIFGFHSLPTNLSSSFCSRDTLEPLYLLWLIEQFWPLICAVNTNDLLLWVSSKWFNLSRPVGQIGKRNATIYLPSNSY